MDAMTTDKTPCDECDGTGDAEVNGMWSPCPFCVMQDDCPQCGTEMVTDLDTDSTTCPFCGWEWSW